MYRRSVWTIGAVILILLMIKSRFFHPWLDIETCRQNPDKYDGALITHFREPRIGSIERDGFWLLQKTCADIFVRTDTSGLRRNEFIGLLATFNRDSTLTVDRLVIARHRRYKMTLSLIPAILILVMLLRKLRWNHASRMLTWRSDA